MPWKRIAAGSTPTTPHPSRKASDNPSAGSSYHKKVRPPQICGGLTYNGHFTLPSERYHFHFISSPHYTRAPSVHQTFPLPSSLFHLPSSLFHLPSSIFHHPSSLLHLPSSIVTGIVPLFDLNYGTFRPGLCRHPPIIVFFYYYCIAIAKETSTYASLVPSMKQKTADVAKIAKSILRDISDYGDSNREN